MLRTPLARIASIAALFLAVQPDAQADDSGLFVGSVATFVDSADGTSVDLDLYLEPTRWLGLGAGFGKAESPGELADLDGNVLRASLDLRSTALGARIKWRRWQDSGQFESDSIAAELYWQSTAGWQAGLTAERRDFAVDYGITVQNRIVPRTASFEGRGLGAHVSWYGAAWGGYLRGMSYDYDAALARVLAASQSPNLARFPRIQALVASLLTRTAGATDHELSAGIERSFRNSGLRLDVSTIRDALSNTDSRGASVSYRYALTDHVEIEGTLGRVGNDGLDDITFAGLALTLRKPGAR